MFDNTKTVTFDEKVYDKILALNSQEGENVPLEEAVMAQVRTPPPHPLRGKFFCYIILLH